MKIIVSVCLLIFFSVEATAKDWVSSTEIKYQQDHPELFTRLLHARKIMDLWRGQPKRLGASNMLLSKILEKNEAYAPAYFELGRVYIAMGWTSSELAHKGEISPAEEVILKALELEPNYSEAHVLLGHYYTLIRKYEEAEAALDMAEQLGTDSPWLKLNRADLHERHGRLHEALALYEEVISSEFTNKKAQRSALGGATQIYQELKQWDLVNQSYLRHIAHEPENAWNWGNYAGFQLFDYGEVDGAIENATIAISLMDYQNAHIVLACAMYTKWAYMAEDPEKSDEAEAYFQLVQSEYPDVLPVIHFTSMSSFTEITAKRLVELIDAEAMEHEQGRSGT